MNASIRQLGTILLDAKKGVCLPTFCDIHTHVDKSHTCERSRNESGSLAGADKSCQIDEIHWTEEELTARMEFSLKTAYAHGTSAIRSHLMSGPTQGVLTWPVFTKLREKWDPNSSCQSGARVHLGTPLVIETIFTWYWGTAQDPYD